MKNSVRVLLALTLKGPGKQRRLRATTRERTDARRIAEVTFVDADGKVRHTSAATVWIATRLSEVEAAVRVNLAPDISPIPGARYRPKTGESEIFSAKNTCQTHSP